MRHFSQQEKAEIFSEHQDSLDALLLDQESRFGKKDFAADDDRLTRIPEEDADLDSSTLDPHVQSSAINDQEDDDVLTQEELERMKKVVKRREVLSGFTLAQDEAEIPITNETLDWRYFNVDFYSHDRNYQEVAGICEDHKNRLIDIRPYIIDTPYLAQSTDRLQKVLELFRHMHLRALAVTNPGTGALEGIITRQDIFAYMGL